MLFLNHALSGPWSSPLFVAITWLGDGLVLAGLVLVPMFLLDRSRFTKHALALVAGVAVSGLLVNVVKPVVDRPRPAEALGTDRVVVPDPPGTPIDRSFPSGHAQTSMATAVYLSFLYPVAAPAFVGLALAVCLSRIALGVHYPSDVAAGALAGALFAAAAFLVNRRRLRAKKNGGPGLDSRAS